MAKAYNMNKSRKHQAVKSQSSQNQAQSQRTGMTRPQNPTNGHDKSAKGKRREEKGKSTLLCVMHPHGPKNTET